jgi:hypothetical protein
VVLPVPPMIPTTGIASFRQGPTPPRWVRRPCHPRRPMPDGPPPMRTAHTRIVGAVILWRYFQTVQSRLRELPSRPGHPHRVMRLPPRSAQAGRKFPGTSQHCRWLGHQGLLHRFTQGHLHQLTRHRRKTSSYRSRTHPGRASSVEPLRARTRPGQGSQSAILRPTSPPSIPRVRSRQCPPTWRSDPVSRMGRRSWTLRRTDRRPHLRPRDHRRLDREREPPESQWT